MGTCSPHCERAREEAQATAADLATATLSIQAELASTISNFAAADAQKRLLDDTVKAYTDALQLTRNRFEGGAAPKSDVAAGANAVDTTQAQDTDIESARAQYEHAIAILSASLRPRLAWPRESRFASCRRFRLGSV